MKAKTVVIFAGAAVALYLVYQNKDEKTKNEDQFAKGFAAGWFAPGPFTIVAVATLAHTYF